MRHVACILFGMSPPGPLSDEEKKWLLILANHKKGSLCSTMPRLVQVNLMQRGFALLARGVPRVSLEGKAALLRFILQ